MKLPTLSRRFWIACSTLAVIGALFAYYLMVYVAGREEKLREEKYRALTRYGENMIHTRKDYYNGVLRNWEKGRTWFNEGREQKRKADSIRLATKKIKPAAKEKESALDLLYRTKKDPPCSSCYDVYKLAGAIDSLHSLQKSQTDFQEDTVSSWWKNYKAGHKIKLNKLVKNDFGNVEYEGYYNEKTVDSLMHYHFDRIYFKYGSVNNRSYFGLFSIATRDFVYRPNQFDEFFIIKKYDESLHEHDGMEVVPANESYQTFNNRVDLHNIDSLMVVEKGLLTSRFGEVKLVDTKYKLFVHSIEFAPGEKWMLCGLMKVENFNNEVRSVDHFVITTAILLVLFLLIAMPILKIVLMNSFEKLTKANVWFAGFSVVCGSATFLLIIWSGSDNLQTQERVNDDLEKFSGSVKVKFEDELKAIYKQLVVADAELSKPLIDYRRSKEKPELQKDRYIDSTIVHGSFLEKIRNHKKDNSQDRAIENAYKTPFHYPYFNFLIWIDGFGKPLITLCNKGIPDDYSMPDLNERKYFRWAMKDSLWYLPGSSPEERKLFTLQSIISWADHAAEAVVALPLENDPQQKEKVLIISTRLHSIMNPLVQLGYGFCILDETGEVWFHSNPDKNHQQNFIGEISQKGLVRAAIKGRMSTFFDAEYEGNRCKLHIQPISNIPLYLVAFHDNEYQRAPVVLTLFFTFILVLIFFLLQGLQLLILFFCERRSSLARSCQSEYFLRAVRPNPDNTNLYRYNSAVMFFVLVTCIGLYYWGKIAVAVIFISLPIFLMAFYQIMFQRKKVTWREWLFQGVSVLLVFLIDILSCRYLEPPYGWVTVMMIQFFLALLLGMTAFWYRKEFSNENVVEINTSKRVTAAHSDESLLKRTKTWLSEYPQVYYINLTLWLMLISLLPVSFFYQVARGEEWLVWTRYEQLETSQLEFARLKVLDEKVKFLNDDTAHRKDVDTLGRYLLCREVCSASPTDPLSKGGDGSVTKLEELLFKAWPRISGPFGISSATISKAASDGKWSSQSSSTREKMAFMPDYRRLSNDRYSYESEIEVFNPVAGPYGPWFFLLIFVCLWFTVRVIIFCTKYIFGINFIPQNISLHQQELQHKIRTARRAFIIGLPYSGKTVMASSALIHTRTIDFQSEDSMIPPKFGHLPCIIRHFDYGINDHAFNQKKLACLKELLKTPNRQIIILSTMQPGVIVDVYHKWIADMSESGEKDDDQKKNTFQEYKTAIRNWKDLLGEFEVYHKSIRPKIQTLMSTDAITEELNACYYLKALTRNTEFQQTTDCNDDFIFRVEETAESYYHAIWSALSPNEKLFLMDLAQDGFVNLKCRTTLRVLMLKGIIVEKESTLVVMNDSFRHFVAGQFQEDDQIEVAKQVEKKGAWYSIRIVLVLVLAAIVIFIALAQEELFKNLNALIVTLSGALAFLTRFGGLFGSGSKAKE